MIPVRSRRLAGYLLGVLLAVACSSVPPPAVAPGLVPWELPDSAFGTQRLFRARYDGPKGEGAFRLAVHLGERGRYQVRASDPLGRALWSLDVTGDTGLWLDHRARVYCSLSEDLELAGAPLSSISLAAFPALLLGRLPERPTAPAERRGNRILYPGEGERRWAVRMEDGQIAGWVLREGGEPVAWWSRRGAEAILSEPRRGVQLRWRETVREPLVAPLEPLSAPPHYRQEVCQGLDLEDLPAPEPEPEPGSGG